MLKFISIALALTLSAAPCLAQRITPSLFRAKPHGYMGITWNNWMNVPVDIDQKLGRNIGFDLAQFYSWDMIQNRASFNLGLALSLVNFHTNVRDFSLDWDTVSNNFSSKVLLEEDQYRKNKLALAYLDVPVEIAFQSHDKAIRSWKLGLGFKGGLAVDAKTKLKHEDGVIVKRKSFENINRWRYGPTVRIGYGPITLFGFYSMTSTFDNEQYPDFAPLTIGLMLTSF